MLDKILTMEKAQDLEFATMVMQEALRFRPPVHASHYYFLKDDCKLGQYNFKKGDILCILFEALGHNSAEWHRPNEMIPDRFDRESPLYLTPDGKKRHAQSWSAFHGGPRVCFGKTLAEGNLKVFITYITQQFNLKFQDPRFQTEIPDQNTQPPIWVKLTTYKK